MLEEGVEGMLRNGDDVRLIRGMLVDDPRLGDVLRSIERRSGSNTEVRTGEVKGKPSSAGFRGVRTRWGDDGLAGRN